MRSFLTTRQFRILVVQSRRWQRRSIFIAGGLLVGLVAVALAALSDLAQRIFQFILDQWRFAPLIVTPLGFGFAVYLATRFFPNTQGSGIPQAIAARNLEETAARSRLVGFRVAVGKVILTLFGLLVGASIGREGPTVQVGASVMFLVGRLTPRRQPGLILAGAAAGVAAAFNTPLAGIVFGIEEMSRSFEVRTSGLIIAAVILAGLTAQAILGDYTYFGFTSASLPIGIAWMAVPLCGVVGGLAGALFSRILVTIPDALPVVAARLIRQHPVWFAILCGLGVALCGLASGGDVFGTGYEQARAVLHNKSSLPLDYAPLKLVATALSSVSGIPGGIFSPSLSIGAGIGADIARVFHGAASGPIVLLAMVAYFTGVVRAPITGFVIVSEMSGDHGMLVPLMASALIADAVARTINRDGVYHMLTRRYALHER
ncbi:MAG TPA: chloride channel protein [Rhizomicrobium sp.]|jgi:H+/Cl- antiporter ClcA